MDPGWYPLVRGMNTNVEMLLEFEALIWLFKYFIYNKDFQKNH